MMDSMSRFSRGLGRHPMPIPHSEDSETDEYNVIDSDRQYERIGDRGSSSTGTSSSRSSNHAMVDPLISQSSHIHGAHLFGHKSIHSGTLGKLHHGAHAPLTTHYAESAIYRRSRGIGSPAESEPPPLIPESQLFISGSGATDGVGWKSQHSTLEFGHLTHLHQGQQISGSTMLANLDSTTNTSSATTTTSVLTNANMASVYESTVSPCLLRTASGSLYIPSDNKGAFLNQKPPLQSINEFTIGGTLKKPDRLPSVVATHSHFSRPLATHLSGSRFRKLMSLQCNWKFMALSFMLLSALLFVAITYIMSTALSTTNKEPNSNCPVMVDDILELNPAQQPQLQPGPGNKKSPPIAINMHKAYHTNPSRITRRLLALHVDKLHENTWTTFASILDDTPSTEVVSERSWPGETATNPLTGTTDSDQMDVYSLLNDTESYSLGDRGTLLPDKVTSSWPSVTLPPHESTTTRLHSSWSVQNWSDVTVKHHLNDDTSMVQTKNGTLPGVSPVSADSELRLRSDQRASSVTLRLSVPPITATLTKRARSPPAPDLPLWSGASISQLGIAQPASHIVTVNINGHLNTVGHGKHSGQKQNYRGASTALYFDRINDSGDLGQISAPVLVYNNSPSRMTLATSSSPLPSTSGQWWHLPMLMPSLSVDRSPSTTINYEQDHSSNLVLGQWPTLVTARVRSKSTSRNSSSFLDYMRGKYRFQLERSPKPVMPNNQTNYDLDWHQMHASNSAEFVANLNVSSTNSFRDPLAAMVPQKKPLVSWVTYLSHMAKQGQTIGEHMSHWNRPTMVDEVISEQSGSATRSQSRLASLLVDQLQQQRSMRRHIMSAVVYLLSIALDQEDSLTPMMKLFEAITEVDSRKTNFPNLPKSLGESSASRSVRSKPLSVSLESESSLNEVDSVLPDLLSTVDPQLDFPDGGDNVQSGQLVTSHHHVPSSSLQMTNIQQLGRTYHQRVAPHGYWHLRYHQSEASLVKFNLSFPSASGNLLPPPILAIYGNRDRQATHTRYDFVEFVGRVVMASMMNAGRSKRANEYLKTTTIQKEFTKYLDTGAWFFTLYNDAQSHVEVSLDLTLSTEELCPFNCRGHGVCITGHCKCDPGYSGESCELQTCPVLCSGRGRYSNGECQCNSGWKGKECHLREDECEVASCNGHGDCVDGSCHCFPGYKGEHCENVDCLDPKCSGHGHCMSGVCLCGKGWKGADCSEPDSDAVQCKPDCSGHGNFDFQLQQCICDERWTGSDCSQERCDLDCGNNGHCEGGECVCDEGWSGDKCMTRLCDPRCLEHGQCQNGTCICAKGWNGKHCSLDGCVRGCSGHGECVRQRSSPTDESLWTCVCHNGYSGLDCSVPLESQCGDNIDNDKDGLVDCADPECCQSKECEGKQLCFSASDPQDILLRKQPPAMTASFYQRMQFLIEEESVQSYAQKMAFNDSRASVIRGQIVDLGGLGITGVRVGVSTDPLLGFTLTRENGWFDLMVNGGGSVTLHLQREPFKSVQKVVNVPVNEIVVLDRIVLSLDGHSGIEHHPESKKITVCSDHDYDKMKPIVVATWKQTFQNSHSSDKSTVLAESQVVQESIRVPGTGIHLLYHSSRSNGFLSTVELQLTPDKIEPTLRLVHLKITVEGLLFEKIFEADPNILYTYAWNRRNIYRQKVYGLTNAVIQVGYQYSNCAHLIWEVQTVPLAGHDMPISEIGGWNLDVHHRYNFHEGILQKGDGTNVYLKKKAKLLTTSVGDGQQRPLHCSYCNGVAKDQRLLAPVALASAPDGSLYVGDFNLVRRLKPDGTITTVVELSESSVAYKYHLAVGPIDGKVYFSDPEKHQVLRVINLDSPNDPRNNLEVFVGTGVKCLPGDRSGCGDGRSARDAKLSYPKGIAMAPTGELYIADGTNIRIVDTFGIIHTLIGDHYHKSHWKPIPCSGSTPINKLTLRWPTQLSISPLDQTLHILDDHMVLKVTSDKRVIIVAGRPSHCPSYGHHRHQASESDDKKDLSDSKDPHATQVFLETPQSIAFGPTGDLYIAESDSQSTNRVRMVSVADQRISRFAGADINCSCMDIACQCFSPDDLLAVNARLSTISSIAVTPDGRVHISDQENLRVRTVYSPLPHPNPVSGEYEIVWPDTNEVYVFNRHGQHILTKSALTGTLIYTFAYNVNTINGKISSVTDSAGNKVYILRDYSNQVKSIENSQGDKCQLSMTRQGLLASFTTPSNYAIKYNYQGTVDALLTSRTDSWGQSVLYKYDEYGRVTQVVLPTGDLLRIKSRLAFDSTKKMVVTYNDRELMRLDVGDRDISKYSSEGEEIFTLERLGSVTPAANKGSPRKLAIRKRDSSHLEIESLNSPVIADSWSKMSELWPLPSIMRIIFNSENVRRVEWRYFVKRNSANGKPTDNKKPSLTSIGRKLKLNGNTVFSIEYDKEARQQTVFDHSNRPTLHMVYDSVGRPIKFISNFNLTPVALEYDRFGRMMSWTRGALTLNLEYDLKGRVTNVKHADSTSTGFKYADSTLGPTEIIKPSGNRYLLQYDANGGLTAVTSPGGLRNELYRQVSLGFYKLLFLPAGFHYPFMLQYDEWGRVTTQFLPNNSGRKVIIYNSLGLVDTELCGAEKTEYTYHLGSELLKSVNKATSDNFDYRVDYRHQGSLLKEERYRFNTRSELSNYKLRYKYDGVGHATEVEFELQGRGVETKKFKFSSTTGAEEGVDSFIFKRHSANVLQIGDERLLKTIATDSYGRVVGITFSVWNKELFSQVIHYEPHRSRISQSRLKYGLNYIHSNFTYTPDGYLEQAIIGGSSSVPTAQKFSYIYDVDGNMKAIYEGETQLTLRRDEAGRVRSFGETNEDLFVVDERGFVISRGATKYMWNANEQMTGAILKDGLNEMNIAYHYDHQNRLMTRFVSSSGSNKNKTQFIYDESSPGTISYCVIDSRIIGFSYDANGHLIALTIEGTKYYVASDHLGSPVAVYTGDGVLVKEIIRNVWGKIIKDSNPSFWLPIDYRGSIRDPLTGLNFFADGRVYDPTIGQWLTPKLNVLGQDLEDMVHLYRFYNNDPVNLANFVRKFDGDLGTRPMSSIESWLHTIGYRLDYIFEVKNKPKNLYSANPINSLPIVTSLTLEAQNLVSQFTHLSMMPESKIKLLPESSGSNFMQMHEMSVATLPSTLSAALISRGSSLTRVFSVESEKNPMINSVLTSVFNGTYSLPFHLVHHSKDEFFFVQPSVSEVHQRMQRDIEQLHKLGSLVNVSRISDSDASGSTYSTSHLLVSTGNLLLNMRYGATSDEELNRVARMARRKAVQDAWQRELYYLRHGLPGLAKHDWSDSERKTLLHQGMVREYFGSDHHGIERYPQLADDPTNVRFKRDSTGLISRKRRNHHRLKLDSLHR